MIFIGMVIAIAVFGMFFKTMPTNYLLLASSLIVIFMGLLKHEHSESLLSIDLISRTNRMSLLKSSFKISISMVLIVLCVISNKAIIGCLIFAISSLTLILYAKIKLKTYLRILSVALAFIFLGGLAIVFNYSKAPMDVLSINFAGGFLGISKISQIEARLVVSKAFGAISALYLMILTTSMSEIIYFLKKLHLPRVIIDLMYLIYRCIFIIYEMYIIMKRSAKSRAGFSSYKRGIRSTAKIYSNLLIRSYMSSSKMFDAMLARCYNGEINFLAEEEYK